MSTIEDPPVCARCGEEYLMTEPDQEPTRYCNECAHVVAEEREADMHVRIREGYDKTVADAWRAKVAELERERNEIAHACEQYAYECEQGIHDGPAALREIRDMLAGPDTPRGAREGCDRFVSGLPGGDCNGDGHHMCRECREWSRRQQ